MMNQLDFWHADKDSWNVNWSDHSAFSQSDFRVRKSAYPRKDICGQSD